MLAEPSPGPHCLPGGMPSDSALSQARGNLWRIVEQISGFNVNVMKERTLAIERRGGHWKGKQRAKEFPGIRLIGQWLQAAGFQPGTRVRVTVLASGRLELTAL